MSKKLRKNSQTRNQAAINAKFHSYKLQFRIQQKEENTDILPQGMVMQPAFKSNDRFKQWSY